MSVLSVSYDLRKPGRNYESLYAALRKYTYCHMLESYWLIDTKQEPEAVRDALCKLVDSNDQIVIFRLHQHWASCMKDRCTEWLKESNRTWD